MNSDDAELSRALDEARRRLAELESVDAYRRVQLSSAHHTLDLLKRHRHRGRVPMWEEAPRAAFRLLALSLGSAALIAGASALDSTLGGAAIVLSFALLIIEGAR